MESYQIIWNCAIPELEKTVSSISFDSYISTLEPVDIIGNKIILRTETNIFAQAVNGKMGDKIKDALRKTNGEIIDFDIVVASSRDEYLRQREIEPVEKFENFGSPVNPKFTFDSFVVGSCNEFLFAAAKAVAENPSGSYNPLFVYGGTGLGKTHVLMAIANYIKKNKPTLNAMYITCEQFTNQLIECISKGKAAEFKRRFRKVDVLLVDDVQFLAKKQTTQEEFFHTFNELVNQNKQIVLTSDRPPKEIEVLEERLRNRFEGGLLADVQPPTLETRIAILRRKSEEQKNPVDLKVLARIAEMDDGDIRSSIGKLTRVIFFSKLHERPITKELVDEALKESAGEKKEEMQAEDIINCVCDFFKVSKNDILSKKKNKEFVEPRQVCIYVITDMMSSLPLQKVGEIMGGKDHSTVIYSRDKIAELMKTDKRLATQIRDIKKMLLKE
ncbi:MAG: chromosomal replication initiator protein DnaA [Clostridia bacterium]|nr:chromosomal replication initiator protein DnaA [Clostridia bacterium]